MNKLTSFYKSLLLVAVLQLPACSMIPEADSGPDQVDILTVFPDGSMRLMGRLVPPEDIIIYSDGFGGEKAAIKVRMAPLHPPFYRDKIIVKRMADDELIVNN